MREHPRQFRRLSLAFVVFLTSACSRGMDSKCVPLLHARLYQEALDLTERSIRENPDDADGVLLRARIKGMWCLDSREKQVGLETRRSLYEAAMMDYGRHLAHAELDDRLASEIVAFGVLAGEALSLRSVSWPDDRFWERIDPRLRKRGEHATSLWSFAARWGFVDITDEFDTGTMRRGAWEELRPPTEGHYIVTKPCEAVNVEGLRTDGNQLLVGQILKATPQEQARELPERQKEMIIFRDPYHASFKPQAGWADCVDQIYPPEPHTDSARLETHLRNLAPNWEHIFLKYPLTPQQKDDHRQIPGVLSSRVVPGSVRMAGKKVQARDSYRWYCEIKFEEIVQGLKGAELGCIHPVGNWRKSINQRREFVKVYERAPEIATQLLKGKIVLGIPLTWFELAVGETTLDHAWLYGSEVIEYRTVNIGATCEVVFRNGLLDQWKC